MFCILSLSQVPRVFIKGNFIGGGDDVVAKDKSGELKKLLWIGHACYLENFFVFNLNMLLMNASFL